MNHKKLIFVSCGQLTDDEKNIGNAIKNLIDSTDDFKAYFAESVHELKTLAPHVFEALYRCSGAIIFLHGRGSVTDHQRKKWGIRSSVWINQEIAILAFRGFLENRPLPILAFKESKNIKLEGAMTSFIINPHLLVDTNDTISKIDEWLKKEQFFPCLEDEFELKWSRLSDNTKKILNCLFSEGGIQVNDLNMERQMKQKYGSFNHTDFLVSLSQFDDTDLVKYEYKNCRYEMSFHPTWKWYVVRALRNDDKAII